MLNEQFFVSDFCQRFIYEVENSRIDLNYFETTKAKGNPEKVRMKVNDDALDTADQVL
jgi:hypothetical protein